MTKQKRWALVMAAAVSAGALTGCPPVPPKVIETQPATTRAASGPGARVEARVPEAPVLGSEPVAKGVYVAVDRRQPLSDKAMVRAEMTRGEVWAAVEGEIRGAATQAATQAATAPGEAGTAGGGKEDAGRDAEPAPQAVKYYLQGRQRFLEGSNSEAMAALEKALQLDPQGFTVLRLMGRVCFAGAQLARGAMYLERAQGLRPADVEVNYLLGRYWLERNDNDRAVYFLMQAEDSPERQITSTHTPLAAFYLGIALQLGGYHLAAAKEYEHFLEVSELPVPGYRYDAELSYLINMQWASHLAAAENYARLGDYHAALGHYRLAAEARPDDAFIGSRLVNALVHDGQGPAARTAALALVTAAKGSEDGVKLLGWTYRATGHEAELIGDLRAQLQGTGRGAADEQAAAVTVAGMQEYLGQKLEAVRTLAEYLRGHPTNLEVLGRLLKRVDTGAALAVGMRAAAEAMAADREHALEVVKLFVPVAEGQAGTMYVKGNEAAGAGGAGGAGSEAGFALQYLEGLTRQAQNEPGERVEAAFEASLKADAGFFPAREAYVSYLLGQEKFAKATMVIDELMKANQGSAKAWQLEVESEAAQQRYVQALQLAQEARAKFPDNVDLRMEMAGVYRLRGQEKEADAELQGIIKDMPKYEAAYRSLVNSLLLRSQRGSANLSADVRALVGTLNTMTAELPESRFGRISNAVIYARGGRAPEAEPLLRGVLAADPDEPDALVPLAQVLGLLGRPTEGAALLESSLKRKAQVEVVRGLAGMYRELDRKADALALVKRYAEENPDAESFALLYATELTTQEKPGEAVAALLAARARFPRSQAVAVYLARLQEDADDHVGAVATMREFMTACGETTERLYLLANFQSMAGDADASVAALQRVLAIMPDHIGANNDLGYFWANAGIHLEQAEPMIRKALDNKPNDPAFLDSLGWLYYKQGKFTEAAALLLSALALPEGTSPEVVQHFGDTLYRMGRGPDAIEQWAKALQMLAIAPKLTVADTKVREYLTKAVTEARAGRVPAVSPIVEAGGAKSAGPAGAPGTMPR